MSQQTELIQIRGARTHNLQNLDIDLPRNRLVVLTGPSGSGKSSLALDTIYAEGQRRYVESLSTYARQFLSVMEKPDVDHIEGLSPAIAIEQKSASHNPRSTVGTATEVYDYLRLLYARAGQPRCPTHGVTLEAQTVSQMVDRVLALPQGARLMLLAPLANGRKGEHLQAIAGLRSEGYVRVRLDGNVFDIDEVPHVDPKKKHTLEAVVDRFRVRSELRLRLAESLETALALGNGYVRIAWLDESEREEMVFSAHFACPQCGYNLSELEPRIFSFNSPAGACQHCDGLGVCPVFDHSRVVAQPELSLPGGALRGWDRRNAYYLQTMEALARHYQFDLDTPYQELPERVKQTLLFGSGDETIAFSYENEGHGTRTRRQPFEGIIPNIQRRYQETESSVVKEELAKYLTTRPCPTCAGTRLSEQARCVYVAGRSLPEITALEVEKALAFFASLELPGQRGELARRVLREIKLRLQFLVDVGLEYLTLDRPTDTLSAGEAQRIRLASQIGAGLAGVMYVLDEPSVGLHQRDNRRLLDTLLRLRDLGNTVIVVEHDEATIRAADHVVDMGPGAGAHGGQVVAQGDWQAVAANPASLTGQYLAGHRCIPVPTRRVVPDPERLLTLTGVSGNNLNSLTLQIPIGLMVCVTGVSGAGKSTLVNDTLFQLAARELNGANTNPLVFEEVVNLGLLDKVVAVDQTPIGRTPRSNPATYTGLFAPIRELFTATPEARSRGYTSGRFSFNVRGGRCEACAGEGLIKVEMYFLPDAYVPCDVCRGRRYNRETLDVRYKGKNIDEVLSMTVEQARRFFAPVPVLARKLETLMDVGLSYLRLGQSATTLSGGEAQRVKLARELSRRDTGNTLYILDEPTTGLHFHDIEQLVRVLHRLRDRGNTVVVIEHNLDVIKTADWVIDLGPEGGKKGGGIVATGPPERVASCVQSHTGRFLTAVLAAEHTPAQVG